VAFVDRDSLDVTGRADWTLEPKSLRTKSDAFSPDGATDNLVSDGKDAGANPRRQPVIKFAPLLFSMLLLESCSVWKTDSQTGKFSDSDLTGKYTVSYKSNLLGFHGDPQTEPRIGFGEIQFDGQGRVTGSDTSSRFGRDRISFIGTYHVDSDLAGTMVITSKFQDGTTATTQLSFKFSDPKKIRFSSGERALDPMGTARTVGPPSGVMGSWTKE
jgi:hypothetical protein